MFRNQIRELKQPHNTGIVLTQHVAQRSRRHSIAFGKNLAQHLTQPGALLGFVIEASWRGRTCVVAHYDPCSAKLRIRSPNVTVTLTYKQFIGLLDNAIEELKY